ncbi:MAG: hypothetical protein WD940_01545 [Patescibacteria group bacterium]
MRIRRPRKLRGNIRKQVAVGEKVVVRGPFVYKLPDPPSWITGINHLNWIEKLIDGLLHRGWFKSSDIYVRVEPDEEQEGKPLAYIIPSSRNDGALVLPGDGTKNLLGDAQILPRFNDGALFVKISS